MKTPLHRHESGKPSDPPRREKSNMDAPQEEFIEPNAVPSQDTAEASHTHTRKPTSENET
jgi:hypothetical protein